MAEARVTRRRAAGALMVAACLGLAACADKLPVDAEGRHTALPPGPTFSKPVSAPADAPVATVPVPATPIPAPGETCGAAELAYLVGKPRTEIPVPVDLTRRRVVCTTCPLDGEVRPERQTITYDTATKLVTKVACG